MLVDVRVDVGRFFVAEGRACRGRVKIVAFPNIFSRAEDSIKENRVWKFVFGKLCTVWPHLLNQNQMLQFMRIMGRRNAHILFFYVLFELCIFVT